MPGDFITCRSFSLAAIILIAPTPAGTAFAQTADTVADTEITELEIDQRSKLNELSTHKPPSREDVTEELRREKRRVDEARKLGVDVSDAEVDEAYAHMASRMRLTAEQLTERLSRAGVHAATIKDRIRADLTWLRYQQLRRQDAPPRDRGGGD
jgi:peptidyl-prolyl cis-trans isomerase SurA